MIIPRSYANLCAEYEGDGGAHNASSAVNEQQIIVQV